MGPGIAKPQCDLRAIEELEALDREIARLEAEMRDEDLVDLKDSLNGDELPVLRALVSYAIRERKQSFRSLAKHSGCTHTSLRDAYKGSRRASSYMLAGIKRGVPGAAVVELRVRHDLLTKQEALRAAS